MALTTSLPAKLAEHTRFELEAEREVVAVAMTRAQALEHHGRSRGVVGQRHLVR